MAATSAAPMPAATIGAAGGMGVTASTSPMPSSMDVSWAMRTKSADARQSSSVPSCASRPNMRAKRAMLSSTDFPRPSAVACWSTSVGQAAEDAAHVGHGGEILARESLHAALEWRARGDAHDGRACQPGVDQLAGRLPLGVGEAARCGFASGDGQDVGRGRAEVDQQRVGEVRGDESCRGEEVRRADIGVMAAGLVGGAEAARAHPEPSAVAELAIDAADERLDAVSCGRRTDRTARPSW